MKPLVKQEGGIPRLDRQGHDTEDARKKTERVDESPFGTEGIFIDADLPEKDSGEN
ncbi:MAG: hypothetical protein WCH07_04630 [Deltaproteobacteria bacterium]